jgi:hypothetical protein
LLASDLHGNPLVRQVAQFVDGFRRRYGKLPEGEDFRVWVTGQLSEHQRGGALEMVQRIFARSLLGEPEHTVDVLLAGLEREAVKNIQSRMQLAEGEGSLEAIGEQIERFKGLLRGGGVPAETWPTLDALTQDEDLSREPDELIPRFVWRGWWTVLAGEAFAGKSTIGAQGAAAFSRARPFLDGRHQGAGRVLYCNVADEPLGLTVQRLVKFDAHRRGVRVFDFRQRTGGLRDSLVRAIEEFNPEVVVIDSLIAWARRTAKEMPGSGDSAAWAEVTRPLGEIAHEHNVGILTYHHATKDGQRYRDSTEIAAAADVLIEMSAVSKQDPNLRRFVCVSRMGGRTVWSATFRDGAYQFGGEVRNATEQAPSVAERHVQAIRDFVTRHPDCAQITIVRSIAANNREVEAAIALMEDRGELHVERGGPGRASKVRLITPPEGILGGEGNAD